MAHLWDQMSGRRWETKGGWPLSFSWLARPVANKVGPTVYQLARPWADGQFAPGVSDPRTWELAAPTIDPTSSWLLPRSTAIGWLNEEDRMSSRHLWWGPPAPTFWDHCLGCDVALILLKMIVHGITYVY